jgi:hypothetical protein
LVTTTPAPCDQDATEDALITVENIGCMGRVRKKHAQQTLQFGDKNGQRRGRIPDPVEMRSGPAMRGEVRLTVLHMSANSDPAKPVAAEMEHGRIVRVSHSSMHQAHISVAAVPDLDLPTMLKSLRLVPSAVVHFSGHGQRDGSIVMKGHDGGAARSRRSRRSRRCVVRVERIDGRLAVLAPAERPRAFRAPPRAERSAVLLGRRPPCTRAPVRTRSVGRALGTGRALRRCGARGRSAGGSQNVSFSEALLHGRREITCVLVQSHAVASRRARRSPCSSQTSLRSRLHYGALRRVVT